MITQNRVLFIVGILIVLLPFLGFPSAYKSFFTFAAGVVVVVLAFIYAHKKRLNEIKETPKVVEPQKSEVFVESRPRFASDTTEEQFTDLASIRDRSKHVNSF